MAQHYTTIIPAPNIYFTFKGQPNQFVFAIPMETKQVLQGTGVIRQYIHRVVPITEKALLLVTDNQTTLGWAPARCLERMTEEIFFLVSLISECT